MPSKPQLIKPSKSVPTKHQKQTTRRMKKLYLQNMNFIATQYCAPGDKIGVRLERCRLDIQPGAKGAHIAPCIHLR